MANKVLIKKIEKKEAEVTIIENKILELENSKKEKMQDLKSLYTLKEREDKLLAEMDRINREVSEK